MKYGIREICDVVLKAKARMKVGNKVFYKDEPVIYFDSLKTSTMEGAATTVYAQGGRGNSRLIAWEGERTVTFTMEDALISTVGLAILTGADVIDATTTSIKQHIAETVEVDSNNTIYVKQKPFNGDPKENWIYVMVCDKDGNPISEPYIYTGSQTKTEDGYALEESKNITLDANKPKAGDIVIVDYYTERMGSGVQQIDITPDKFGGNFYLEASTLFRDTNGTDMLAEFIIPNCKVQSNFTFSMASSGDPSTFTFTMDAFPGYTRFNPTKKVLSAIQIITEEDNDSNNTRSSTDANETADELVVAAINAIESIDLAVESTVTAARTAYDALEEDYAKIKQVYNVEKLLSAEAYLKEKNS